MLSIHNVGSDSTNIRKDTVSLLSPFYLESPRRLTSSQLHIFKGTFPDDEEIDRLHLTVLSNVTPAGPEIPEAGDRPHVLHVSGFANGAVLENSVVTSGQEVRWLFQTPDEKMMNAWLLKLEKEIIDQRCSFFLSLQLGAVDSCLL